MTFRPLTSEEIGALPAEFYADTDKLRLGARYTPDLLGVLVGAFDSGKLVGVWAALPQIHAGPVWVAAEYRGRSKAIRDGLWRAVSDVVRGWGFQFAVMFARPDVPQVGHMIEAMPHHSMDGAAYLVEVG